MSEPSPIGGALVSFAPDEIAELAPEETRQVIVFEACGERFALPVDAVREIQPLPPLTRVPTAPPEVEGIVNLRGHVLTLFGLASCLGIPADPRPASHAVVLDFQDADLTIGLAVQRIGEVRRIPLSALDAPPAQDGAAAALDAVFEVDGQVVGLLNPRGVFARFLSDWGIAPDARMTG